MPDTQSSLHFIDHGEHRIAVLGGNPHAAGTPLVFLHGIAGSVHFWPALLPTSIKDHRRWYSIGLPGHYPGTTERSSLSREAISAKLFAEILASAVRELSPGQPVALIGYSTGGFAALNLAARQPELVATVVSVSGFSVGRWHGILGRLQALASRGRAGRRASAVLWSLMALKPALFRRLLLLNAATLEPNSPERESLLALAALDAKRQPAAVLTHLMANIRRFDIRPLLEGIRVPTLIAGGDRDPVIRYQHTCELAAAIRGAELATFHNVGHLFFVECLNQFQQVLEDWIERHCAARGSQQAA